MTTKTEKYCNGCHSVLPIEIFIINKHNNYSSRCRPCLNADSRKRHAIRKLDPEYRARRNATARKNKALNPRSYMMRRGEWLKYRFGLTLEDYDKMLSYQNGVCAICQQKCKTGKGLGIDHDHRCCSGNKSCGKCIRGLLCANCNGAIGMLQEDVAILKKAIVYLTSPQK